MTLQYIQWPLFYDFEDKEGEGRGRGGEGRSLNNLVKKYLCGFHDDIFDLYFTFL